VKEQNYVARKNIMEVDNFYLKKGFDKNVIPAAFFLFFFFFKFYAARDIRNIG